MPDSPKAILVVEDNADDASLLQLLFEEVGLVNPIEVAYTVPDAVAYLKGSVPYSDRAQYPRAGVVFLDMKLPGMDGFDFLEWLKAHSEFNDLLIVAVSGLDDLPSVRRAYSLGVDSFLSKPCRTLDLENLMQWFPGYWERSIPALSRD